MKDRRCCEHYMPEDDTDCPHYQGVRDDYVSDDGDSGCLWRMILLIAVVCISAIANQSGVDPPFSIVFIAVSGGLLVLAAIIWLMVRGGKLMNKRRICIKTRKHMKEENNKEVEAATTAVGGGASELSTRTFLQVVLRKLNLSYEFDEDQNFIVGYHGETFRIIAKDDLVYLYIQDLAWYDAPLDDIDNLSILYKAVNECNMRETVRLVYTYDKAENELHLHTLYDILWMCQIPDAESYLRVSLDNMLRSHQLFFKMMEELRREEFARQNHS